MKNSSKIKAGRNRIVIICLFMVTCVILLLSSCGDGADNEVQLGVNDLKLVKNPEGNIELKIGYTGLTGYSVTTNEEVVKPELWEGEVKSESCAELGEYRVGIKLYDSKLSDTIKLKYVPNKPHKITDVEKDIDGEYDIFITYPPDDSLIYIIIGSDTPFFVEEKTFTKTEEVGKILVELKP